MSTPPTSYNLSLYVEVDHGMCRYTITAYDARNITVGRAEQERVTTFCFDWRDLVASIERLWEQAGGSLPALTRPSPYVDLS